MREVLPHGTAERAEVEVRRVTRALGPVRELDVALACSRRRSAAHDVDDAAARWRCPPLAGDRARAGSATCGRRCRRAAGPS